MFVVVVQWGTKLTHVHFLVGFFNIPLKKLYVSVATFPKPVIIFVSINEKEHPYNNEFCAFGCCTFYSISKGIYS